jgi:hypothetical protein
MNIGSELPTNTLPKKKRRRKTAKSQQNPNGIKPLRGIQLACNTSFSRQGQNPKEIAWCVLQRFIKQVLAGFQFLSDIFY